MEKRVSFSLGEPSPTKANVRKVKDKSPLPPHPSPGQHKQGLVGRPPSGARDAVDSGRSVSIVGLVVITGVLSLLIATIFTDFGLAEIYRGDYLSDSIRTAMQHLNKHDNSILLVDILKPLSESITNSSDLTFAISLNDHYLASKKGQKDVQVHRALSHMVTSKVGSPTFLDLGVWVDENRLSFPNGNHFQISLLENVVIETTMDINVLTAGAHELTIHANVTVEAKDGQSDAVQVITVHSSSVSYFFFLPTAPRETEMLNSAGAAEAAHATTFSCVRITHPLMRVELLPGSRDLPLRFSFDDKQIVDMIVSGRLSVRVAVNDMASVHDVSVDVRQQAGAMGHDGSSFSLHLHGLSIGEHVLSVLVEDSGSASTVRCADSVQITMR